VAAASGVGDSVALGLGLRVGVAGLVAEAVGVGTGKVGVYVGVAVDLGVAVADGVHVGTGRGRVAVGERRTGNTASGVGVAGGRGVAVAWASTIGALVGRPSAVQAVRSRAATRPARPSPHCLTIVVYREIRFAARPEVIPARSVAPTLPPQRRHQPPGVEQQIKGVLDATHHHVGRLKRFYG